MKDNKSSVPWTPADLASFVFPQRCPFCDGVLPFQARLHAPLPAREAADVWIHPACYPAQLRLQEPLCLRCGKELSEGEGGNCRACREKSLHFKQNRAIWQYEEPARSAITRFKYHGRQQYAVYFARAWLMANREYLEEVARPQVLIPVPIHKSRLRKRGYNQAALIAYELEKMCGIPCREDILIRTKHTGAQKDLGPVERLLNMENAFRINQIPEGMERVLLVDDIYTTGSTLESISRLLQEAGIPHIFAATLSIAGGKT